MNAIQLSTGHVFAAGSVVSVTPLAFAVFDDGFTGTFQVVGVGFEVPVRLVKDAFFPGEDDLMKPEYKPWLAECEKVRQEAITKLIGAPAP